MWSVVRDERGWDFVEPPVGSSACIVMLSQASAWKVFTKRLGADEALQRFPDVRIEGDPALGRAVVEMVSVMA